MQVTRTRKSPKQVVRSDRLVADGDHACMYFRRIGRLPAGRRRRRLDEWLRGELALRFEARIVVIDGAIADEWGRLVARQEARGRPIAAMDALIAATA
jgi:predicted nucleic acid-binding protein